MPWKETRVSDDRIRFVVEARDGLDSMAVLCRRFGVSRRTGYKWLGRYEQDGPAGLEDRSRAPERHPNEVGASTERRVVTLRQAHPTWGPRKLRALLRREDPGGHSPAASTIGAILGRHGLSVPRRARPRRAGGADPPNPLGDFVAPNRVWCADYKGWFLAGDGRRCDPLTIMDGYSRFLIRCPMVPRLDYASARRVFEAAFRECGLPEAIRTDNGEPGTGVAGLSRLSVWWVRLGIALQRIEPGRPQQNGSHERMHQTLKRETASPPAATYRGQCLRGESFRRRYNEVRPHEALGMRTPAEFYEPSPREYPERLRELEYGPGLSPRRVDERGTIRWHVTKVFLSKALGGEVVALDEIDAKLCRVLFGPLELGLLDAGLGRLLRPCERRRRGL